MGNTRANFRQGRNKIDGIRWREVAVGCVWLAQQTRKTMAWHLKQSISSQERAAVFWQTYCLDILQSQPAKLSDTQEKFCCKGNETESCLNFQSGTTSEHSGQTTQNARTHSQHGKEYQRNSPFAAGSRNGLARTSAAPERAQESTANALECGWKWHGSFVKFDPASSSWKTRQCSLLAGLDEFSETWPRWGMMRDGECLGLATLERHTSGNEFGFWPTATVCGNYNRKGLSKNSGDGLATAVAKWPTPQASDNRDRGHLGMPAIQRRQEKGKQIGLGQSVSDTSGALNPPWVEWLMGWPLGWTDLKPSEMARFQAWRLSHGKF